LFYINRPSFNLKVVFGTVLKVEGLQKRLGLGLARSRSWTRGKNQTSPSRLTELQEGLGLGLVS